MTFTFPDKGAGNMTWFLFIKLFACVIYLKMTCFDNVKQEKALLVGVWFRMT